MRAYLLFGSATALLVPLTAAFAAGTSERADSVVSKADGGSDASTPPRHASDAGPPIDWLHIPVARYATALHGYRSSVSPGNQVALNSAVATWAAYITGMHNRLHPLFADQFLVRLDTLERTDARNENALVVRLEIALDEQGRIARLGVVQSSGVDSFDVGALEAIRRAAPFAAPPADLWSFDGLAYLHWIFRRDETFACSTMNARPFHIVRAVEDGGGAPDAGRDTHADVCRPSFRYAISDAGREFWEKVDCSAQQGDAGRPPSP